MNGGISVSYSPTGGNTISQWLPWLCCIQRLPWLYTTAPMAVWGLSMSHPPPDLPTNRAFVVQFRYQSPEAPCAWEGRVEHLASGHVGRFHSAEELLAFLARELTVVQQESGSQ